MMKRIAAYGMYALFVAMLFLLMSGDFRREEVFAAPSEPAEPVYGALWKSVSDSLSKGLPREALSYLKAISRKAEEGKVMDEAFKARTMTFLIEGTLQDEGIAYSIEKLRGEYSHMDAELRPFADMLLARWYMQYFNQNSWEILQRTRLADSKTDDIAVWDGARFFSEIDACYGRVFEKEERLKKMPLSDYALLLYMGSAPRELRPTLFDFAAYEAIAFYTSPDRRMVNNSQGSFEIEIDSGAFLPADGFIARPADPSGKDSGKYKALELYRKLLAFHRNDEMPDAFVDADLSRLGYVYSEAAGASKEKDEIYLKRLSEIAAAYRSSPVSTRALYEMAAVYNNQDLRLKAMELIDEAKKRYPDSFGAAQAAALESLIRQKALGVSAEKSVLPGKAFSLTAHYRNIDALSVKIFQKDRKSFLESRRSRDRDTLRALLKKQALHTLSFPLKASEDYGPMEQELSLPALDRGFYTVVASYRGDFSEKDNIVAFSEISVSEIAAALQSGSDIGGFVVQGETGKPAPGAAVTFYSYDYKGEKYVAERTLKTDGEGKIPIRDTSDYSSLISVADGRGSELFLEGSYRSVYSASSDSNRSNMVFFTDRAIYRPGQEIFFKGVAVSYSASDRKYAVIPKREVEILLRDVNGQTVAQRKFTTNEYGSVWGSFEAPADRLLGRMQLVCQSPSGSAAVQVEEYKRPNFFVNLEKPKGQVKLGGTVRLEGDASAYSGAFIDGAKVSYRITREVQYPFYMRWFFPAVPPVEIASGTAKTDEKGRFAVDFTAAPDRSAVESDQPVFTFRVAADVTDSSGETRSAQQYVTVGYSPLQMELGADEWQTADAPVKLRISSHNTDGVPVTASGTVRIRVLKQPSRPQRMVRSDGDPRFEEGASLLQRQLLSWPAGDTASQQQFVTGADGTVQISFPLKPGAYLAELTAKDGSGKEVTARYPLAVFDKNAAGSAVNLPFFCIENKTRLEVGETFEALLGSGYENCFAFVEVLKNGKVLASYWTDGSRSQYLMRRKVTEDLRGGFTLNVFAVRENCYYSSVRNISVPWSNKELKLTVESLTSKLKPQQESSVTLSLQYPGNAFPAEVLACMYDKSLDAFMAHSWPSFDSLFEQNSSSYRYRSFSNSLTGFSILVQTASTYMSVPFYVFPTFAAELQAGNSWNYGGGGRRMYKSSQSNRLDMLSGAAPMAETSADFSDSKQEMAAAEELSADAVSAGEADSGGADSGGEAPQTGARKDFSETAFFKPNLLTSGDGKLKIEFKMPDSLTTWRLMAFAHGKAMENGFAEYELITQKDLMVETNAPRFLREGDVLYFAAKVTNMTDREMNPAVSVAFFDPATGKDLGGLLKHKNEVFTVRIPAGQSRSVQWPVTVPDGLVCVAYRTGARADVWTDAEENVLPVVSRRIAVTESLPLWINGPGERSFSFDSLRNNKSDTLVSRTYVVQMASNPMWYAVQALPYLMEYPHECSEQVFSRLYANSLAESIVRSNPDIETIFRKWEKESPDALLSNLEKNSDLKSVLLLETPWVAEAKTESAAKRNIALLFERKSLEASNRKAVNKLSGMQLGDGSWPWFPGGRSDSFITFHILAGFGKLHKIGVYKDFSQYPFLKKSVDYMDRYMNEMYRDIENKKDYRYSSVLAYCLYARSFYLDSYPLSSGSKKAYDYFLSLAEKEWLRLNSPLSEAQTSLALHRFGRKETALAIVESLKQRAVRKEEMGMYFKEERSWLWYRAPIETQVAVIEMLEEVSGDKKSMELCQMWLLKQKQTQNWKTTKATADAVYALMLNNAPVITKEQVQITAGNLEIKPDRVEEGTGFFEKRYQGEEIKPSMGEIRVKKIDKGIAWGGVYWQYLEDVSKVKPHEPGALNVRKEIFLQSNTPSGPQLKALNSGVKLTPGDLLKVRIEIRSDRDMEYVHLSDDRGSGLEPVNVISAYKYGSFAYYESVKDTSTHFYIDFLPKGTYVFEYPLRVVHKGAYQSGIARMECMYAPEFSSHSGSYLLKVE